MGASRVSLELIVISMSAVAGNIIAPHYPASISVNQRLLGGSIIACAFGFAAIMATSMGHTSLLAFIAPVTAFSFCSGVASPVSQTRAIQADSQLSGTASGFSIFLSMFVASVATQIVSRFNNGTELVIALPLFLFTSLALVCVLAVMR